MPYSHEFLKKHISTAHPELLDDFVAGWNGLGPLSQARWRQQAFITPKKKVEPFCWLSWTTVRKDELFASRKNDVSIETPLKRFEKQLGILFHDSMQNAGHMFRLPHMRPLGRRQFLNPTGKNPSSSERHLIAKDAANFVIRSELRNLLIKWKKDLDEHGLEALQKVYLAAPQLEEEDDEKTFDFGNFNPRLVCDSGSDLSDDEEEE